MLTIRAEQMQVFEAESMRRFKQRLRTSLTRSAPHRLDLDALVERGVAEASAFGLVSEQDTARFVAITGHDLGGFPAGRLPVPALAILMSLGLPPSVKLDRYQAWAQAAVKAGSAGAQ